MFHKRKKQVFPEGTFIPTLPRVLAIIQLCLGFAALLFATSKPFIEDHFTIKSRILLYDFVMGHNSEERYQLFNELDDNQKEMVLNGYDELMQAAATSFFTKLKSSLDLVLIQISAFERAWILFAIIIPILLLKKVEGARQAVWILPLIASAYLLHHQLNEKLPILSEEAMLYPKEDWLVERYLHAKLSSFPLAKQQKELLKAWQLYLIEYFTKESPSSDQKLFQKQLIKGEFTFHLARIEKLLPLAGYRQQQRNSSPFLLITYLIWNLKFALAVSLSKRSNNVCFSDLKQSS